MNLINSKGDKIALDNRFDIKLIEKLIASNKHSEIDDYLSTIKGYPTHEQGGVDIKLGEEGVSFARNNREIKAKHGLVLPTIKAQKGVTLSKHVVQKGDTLSSISKNTNTPIEAIVSENKIQDPNKIYYGKVLNIPYKYEKPLKEKEISQTHHPNRIIDDYSANFNYIVQGDKIYYSKKNRDYWVDISDNRIAKENLYNHLDNKHRFKGYSNEERIISDLLKSKTYNYTERYNKATNNIQTEKRKKDIIYDNNIYRYNEGSNQYDKTPVDNRYVRRTPLDAKIVVPDKKIPKYLANPNTGTRYKLNSDTNTIQKVQENDEISFLDKAVYSVKNVFDENIDKVSSSISDAWEVANNGLKRRFDMLTLNTEGDVETRSKESDAPLSVKDYYRNNYSSNSSVSYDAPKTDGRVFKEEKLDLSTAYFGSRNRGDYKELNTEGLNITIQEPFLRPKMTKGLKDNSTVIGVDDKGQFVKGIYKDFKDRGDVLISKTFVNKVVSFDEKDGVSLTKTDSKHGNNKFQVPIVNVVDDKTGKIIKGSLNILTSPGKEDFYGNVQGGRFIIENPDTKKTFLVSGSLRKIKKEFNAIKGTSKYANVYVLDNGTYSRGLSYKDNKLSSERLRSYDNENTGGGNGLYIKSYEHHPSSFKTEFYETPNIRTKNDESFKKGKKLKNEIKSIVLHYTAYQNSPKDDSALHKQFMTKNNNSSHIVVLGDGTKRIYASPEQVTFHAGDSKWKNRENVNDFSIGIEFQNPGRSKLTEQQVASGVEYISELMDKYNIPLSEVITHSMVAPGRKQDLTNEQYQQILSSLKIKGYK